MTTLPSARRRAEEFADAVDPARGGTGGRSSAAAAGPLLEMVEALRSVPEASAPRPEFTVELRQRLLAEAATVLVAAAPVRVVEPGGAVTVPHRHTRRPGRVVAAASAFVVVGGTAGMATAAQSALPGEALYPVKRALEGAELRLSTSDAGRGRKLLEQATSRLEELDSLLPATGSGAATASVAARLPGTVRAFTSQAVEGSGLMLDAFEDDRDPDIVDDLRTFTATSVDSLSGLAAVAPSEVGEELAAAAAAMQSVDETAVELCPTCSEGDPPVEVPRDFGEPPEDEVVGASGSGGAAGDGGVAPTGQEAPAGDASSGEGTEGGEPGASAEPSEVVTPTDPAAPTDTGTGSTDGATDDGTTDGPSQTPSGSPSDSPSDDGTGVPSQTPSGSPSESPSESPSDGGTGGGTGVNSGDDPGDKPSDAPTDAPTDAADPGIGDAEETAGSRGGGNGGGNGGGRGKPAGGVA